MKIFVVSLKTAKARRASVEQQFASSGLDWQFFDAVVGKDLPSFPEGYDRKSRLRKFGYDMTPGEIGCFLSHQGLWREALKIGEPIFVLEDDFRLECPPGELKRLIESLSNESECSLIRFAAVFDKPNKKYRDHGQHELVVYKSDPAGTAAYLIYPGAAKALLNSSKLFHVAVDDFMAREFEHQVIFYGLTPYPITTLEVESTISGREKKKKTVYGKIKREIFRIPDALSKAVYLNAYRRCK